ncbi:hypothetical protein KUTeg_022455 [Tegillarca granosa]|uniref:Uncharacterized protein n=1 Tax=Tegillarca granosa TaxID=220873 RepID=A0ABQ9E691_TEGGR|nr:hypothetical protein KUTeg_022455 [Tegillarca granosa]
MLMWALSFAALNRIGFRDLESNIKRKAQDMALFHFLPNQDDYNNLKVRMEVMMMRILKEYFNAFKEVDVVDHIPHDYSEDSSKKTKIICFIWQINLGVLHENPSSTAGVIAIMEHPTQICAKQRW